MRRWIFSLFTLASVMAFPAWGQLPSYVYPNKYGPYQRPPVSPYLNILNNGNPAVGYYLGKMAETDRRNFQANVGAYLNQFPLNPNLDGSAIVGGDLGFPTLEQTGHPAVFMNNIGYFQPMPAAPPMRTYNPFPVGGMQTRPGGR